VSTVEPKQNDEQQVLAALEFEPRSLCSWTNQNTGEQCTVHAELEAVCTGEGCGVRSPVCGGHRDVILHGPIEFVGRCKRCGTRGLYRDIVAFVPVAS
jgi:hypothetical protein